MENDSIEQQNEEQTNKKGRHRKKQLYSSILNQMEFYFSDSNLTKDRFFGSLVKENEYVSLDVFLKCNKIRKLTTNLDDVRKAIKNSTLIELNEDQTGIKRTQPIKIKKNVEECTIYIERLKADATHEWLSSIFSEFGNVVYVSIPKYKHNQAVKGFAFLEFDNEKEAESALHYFDSIGLKMSSDAGPEGLPSFPTYDAMEENGSSEMNEENKSEVEENAKMNAKKRKLDELNESTEDESSKKVKTDNDESELEESDEKKKKKHKKEQKKKHHFKELGLQILSKRDWRQMRNRYLDMQRKKMKEFKKHLNRAKFSQANYEDKNVKSKPAGNLTNGEENVAEEPAPTLSTIQFVEGVIVKIKLAEPCSDVKKLKNDYKAMSENIKYVDLPNPGSEHIYLRFDCDKNASSFCENEKNAETLKGDEEKAYWDKIMTTRDAKFQKSNKKRRGRDKLLRKANKMMNQHIKFDDQ